MSIAEYDLPNGRKLEIHHEEDPESPRTWDNLCTMVCQHKRYNLGDNHDIDLSECRTWAAVQWAIKRYVKAAGDKKVAIIRPLYLYDHSGLSISTRGFRQYDSAGWDWGQIGWIYCTERQIEAEYGRNENDILSASERHRKKMEQRLQGEVETYDQYLRGDIYGFIVRKAPCEHCGAKSGVEDSCWGYYGTDIASNGILDNLSEEDREAVKKQIK